MQDLIRTTVVAACLLLASAAGAAEFPDYPFVHTSGSGFVYVAPDVGEIDFEIVQGDADPDKARAGIEARIAEIRTVLASAGIAAGDIDIRDIRREIRKADPARTGLAQVEFKCGVHIKVADLSKWKSVLGPLIAMPELDGFLVGFDATRREQIEGELTADALKMARRKAELVAGGIGRKLGQASAVSMGDLKNITRAVGLANAQSVSYRNPVRPDPDREGLLMIAPMKLAQSVDVIYRLK